MTSNQNAIRNPGRMTSPRKGRDARPMHTWNDGRPPREIQGVPRKTS